MHSVLAQFGDALANANMIVAHSWQWHKHVLEWTYGYYGHTVKRKWPTAFDTMIKGADYVGIEAKRPGGGNKWPSFNELTEKVLSRPWRVTGDPIADGIQRVRIVKLAYDQITRLSD
jgi:hypothetical protein